MVLPCMADRDVPPGRAGFSRQNSLKPGLSFRNLWKNTRRSEKSDLPPFTLSTISVEILVGLYVFLS
jgi:hypothetical protein